MLILKSMTIENKEFNIFFLFFNSFFKYCFKLQVWLTCWILQALRSIKRKSIEQTTPGAAGLPESPWWIPLSQEGFGKKNHNDKTNKKIKLKTEARNWFSTYWSNYSCISLNFCQSVSEKWTPLCSSTDQCCFSFSWHRTEKLNQIILN